MYGPKIVRAAAGSLFRMPVFSVDSPERAVSLLEAAGKTVSYTHLDVYKRQELNFADRWMAFDL